MHTISRRSLLAATTAGAALVGLPGSTAWADSRPVPFSAGTRKPRFRAPAGAVDTHMHVYDPICFPYAIPTATPPPRATVQDYRALQQRLRLDRVVVVTPSNYSTDNRATLDAIAQFGATARGVAVIDETFSTAQIADLAGGGIRGIRFNLTRPGGAGVELIRPLAARVADFGWHVQIHMTAEGILQNLPVLSDLPTDLVIDHMGRIPGEQGTAHPAFAAILGLIDRGRTWVKVSGVYHESVVGPPRYEDRSAVGAAFVARAPERMLWGTDWPHPTASRGEVPMPDDAVLLDIFASWCRSRRIAEQILVANPETVYGFAPVRHRCGPRDEPHTGQALSAGVSPR
jgi:D-galactarolactone isomerase